MSELSVSDFVDLAVNHFVERKTRPFEVIVGDHKSVYQGVVFSSDVTEWLIGQPVGGIKAEKIHNIVCRELQNRGFYVRKGLY